MTLSPRMWRVGGIAAAVLLLVGAWFALISPTMQQGCGARRGDGEPAGRVRAAAITDLPAEEAERGTSCPGGDPGRDPAADATDRGAADPHPEPDDGGEERQRDRGLGHPWPADADCAPVVAAAASPRRGVRARADDSADSSTDAPEPVAPAAPQVQAVSLNISACGTFAQLRNYLREIESMQRVAMVSSVSIARGSCARGCGRGRPDGHDHGQRLHAPQCQRRLDRGQRGLDRGHEG